MNGRERILRALDRQPVDRVPILELIISDSVIKGIENNMSYEDFVDSYDIDGVCAFEDSRVQEIDERTFVDEWGVIRGVTGDEGAPIKGPIKSELDLAQYSPPDPWADYKLDSLSSLVKRFKGRKAIIFFVPGPFEIPSFLRGVDNFLADYILNPKLVKKLAQMCTDYGTTLAKRAIKVGADIIGNGDDIAYKIGPFMSRGHFKEFVRPYLKTLVRTAKKNGAHYIQHTDGNIWPIMDLITNLGIDGLHPIDPSAGMDIGKVKKKYGDKICLIGNIDCAHLLCYGSPDSVKAAVKRCIAEAAPGWGYILSSSNSIHSKVDPRNYLAMIEAAKEYGGYPVNGLSVSSDL